MKTKTQKRPIFAALMLTAALGLTTSCKTTEQGFHAGVFDSLSGKKKKVEERLSTAAQEAIKEGRAGEAVAFYEKLYLRNSKDAEIALNYAQALRKTGEAQRALLVLGPFLESYEKEQAKKKKADKSKDGDMHLLQPAIWSEYAASNLELGRYDRTLLTTDRILENESFSAYHAYAQNMRGIVFDAQGQFGKAEKAYRMALDTWVGDPTSVMNNLALSLAQQGHFDESLNTLRRAFVMAPEREELARNIEIVSNLRDTLVATPSKK